MMSTQGLSCFSTGLKKIGYNDMHEMSCRDSVNIQEILRDEPVRMRKHMLQSGRMNVATHLKRPSYNADQALKH